MLSEKFAIDSYIHVYGIYLYIRSAARNGDWLFVYSGYIRLSTDSTSVCLSIGPCTKNVNLLLIVLLTIFLIHFHTLT